MPNPFFRFKQFTVYHDRCAMKVGTDGVLLGAWTNLSQSRRILDIGTGTGLIALMMAQRVPEVPITAIDIDAEAVNQANENFSASPYSKQYGSYPRPKYHVFCTLSWEVQHCQKGSSLRTPSAPLV